MIGKGTAIIHLVPYDFVIRSAVYLTHLKDGENKTYHVINPSPPTIKDAFASLLYELHGKKARFTIPVSIASAAIGPRFIQRLLGVPKETLDYFSGQHLYDCSALLEDLRGSGISCQPFPKLAPAMVTFYNEHADNKNFMKSF
ncbi:hypothetical protein ACFQPF_03175 [Fictibacillus iocasae]|uniref:NmrA-like domain-containing protein n=1 Tax=Fictibacillus iocasae TaxID=2715437 RepID=A0ABW2NNA3_9BACL